MKQYKQTQSAVIYILTAFFLFLVYCVLCSKKPQENGYIDEISNKELNEIEGNKYLNL
jgi:hypothetical protein